MTGICEGRVADTLETLTMTPPASCCCMTPLTAWLSSSGASRLSSVILAWKRGEASAARAYGAPPALLTSTSRRP